MTVNYNDGNWHGWNGGACPVHLRSEVEIIFLHDFGDIGKETSLAGNAAFTGNGHGDVIAFRVVKEYREPREWWVNLYESGIGAAHTSKKLADRAGGRARIECIKVREVVGDE